MRLVAWIGAGLPALGGAIPTTSREPSPDRDTFQHTLREALQGHPWTMTDKILIDVPELAENGAIVPLSIESALPGTGQILIFVEKNPYPLVARFQFEPEADGWISLRIKMNETSDILVIAESQGRYFGARKKVQVMLGGCG
jgi:sulfur-oxidizing protein SoxY